MKSMKGREQRKILYRLLSYAKPHKKRLFGAFLLLFLATIADITGPILVKIFIDDYLTPMNMSAEPIMMLAVGYLLLLILKMVITYYQQLEFQHIALHIIQQLRVDVFSKVQSLGMKYFDRTPAGATVSRITNDTEAIKDMFIEVIAGFISSGFFIIGTIIGLSGGFYFFHKGNKSK